MRRFRFGFLEELLKLLVVLKSALKRVNLRYDLQLVSLQIFKLDDHWRESSAPTLASQATVAGDGGVHCVPTPISITSRRRVGPFGNPGRVISLE